MKAAVYHSFGGPEVLEVVEVPEPKMFADQGCKIVGISDVTGAYVNQSGLDLDGAIAYAQEHHSLDGYRGGEKMSNQAMLEVECDVLVPAALEKVLNVDNALRIKTKLIVEGANGPTTSAADDVLAEKKVFVIPDILANAGGVTTSYFEWVQDRQGYFWKESVVNEQLDTIMKSSFEDVVRYAETHQVNNRIAAYMLAIDRVAYTIRQRGIYA